MLLYERLYVLVIVTAAAVAGAFFISKGMTPVYRSQTKFFRPSGSDVFSLNLEGAGVAAGPRLPTASEELQASLLGLLRSGELRTRVANMLPERDSVFLQKQIKFDLDPFNVLVITAWDTDPAMAALVANTYFKAFEEDLVTRTEREMASKLRILEETTEREENELLQAQAERIDFMRARSSVDYNAEFESLSSRIGLLRKDIGDRQLTRATLGTKIAALEAQMEQRPDWVPGSRARGRNPRVTELTSRIGQYQQEIETKKLQLTELHPEIIKLRAQVQAAAAEIARLDLWIDTSETETADPLYLQLEKDLLEQERQEVIVQAEIVAREGQLAELMEQWRVMPAYGAQLTLMDEDIQKRKHTIDQLKSRRQELVIQESGMPTYLELTEVAEAATKPSYPNTGLNMIVAGVLGTVAGFTVVVLMARMAAIREEQLLVTLSTSSPEFHEIPKEWRDILETEVRLSAFDLLHAEAVERQELPPAPRTWFNARPGKVLLIAMQLLIGGVMGIAAVVFIIQVMRTFTTVA